MPRAEGGWVNGRTTAPSPLALPVFGPGTAPAASPSAVETHRRAPRVWLVAARPTAGGNVVRSDGHWGGARWTQRIAAREKKNKKTARAATGQEQPPCAACQPAHPPGRAPPPLPPLQPPPPPPPPPFERSGGRWEGSVDRHCDAMTCIAVSGRQSDGAASMRTGCW